MIYAIGVIIACAVLFAFKKSGHFFRSVFTSIIGGVSSLLAVNVVGWFIPVSLGVNVYSLVFASFFSVPGVIFLLLAKSFLL